MAARNGERGGNGRPAGFALTVPASWFEIDVSPATRNASIARLVEDRVRDVPELYEQRAAITKLLRQMAREAHEAGAVYCAGMVEPVEGVGLTASVTVSAVTAAGPSGAPLPTAVSAIAASLTEKRARNDDDSWRKVAVVDLPGVGPAARAYGVEDVDLPEGAGWIRCVTMQTLVPIPGTDQVAVVACSSPSLPLADEFHDLFDAVTSTFRFVQPDSEQAGREQGSGGSGTAN